MLWIALGCTSPEPTPADSAPPAVCTPDLTLSLDENPANTLSPLATIDADLSFRIRFEADGVSPRSTAGEHVVGLRPDTTYTLTAWTGDRCSEPVEWTTGSLPGELRPVELAVPWDGSDDGTIVVAGPVHPGEPGTSPWLVGFDRAGEVVYYVDLPQETGRARDLLVEGDRFFVPTPHQLVELDPSGRVQATVAFPLTTNTHHDVVRTPDGFLVMYEEIQQQRVDGYGVVDVAGDLILEIDLDGQELWRWSAFDHIPVEGFDTELVQTVLDAHGVLTYTHANSLSVDGDTLVMSLRHQHAVIGVDRPSGAIAWRVDGASVQPPFAGQHDASVDGQTLTLFDNLGGATSRATTYDLTTGDASWSHTVEGTHETFGSVEPLDGGDLLVAAVGQRADAAGVIQQVTPDGQVVWELRGFTQRWVYRARPLEGWVTVE